MYELSLHNSHPPLDQIVHCDKLYESDLLVLETLVTNVIRLSQNLNLLLR